MGFPGGSVVKNPPAKAEDARSIPGLEDPLEEEVANHSSILAWVIPWTEEPGGLQSIGLQESDTTEQLSMHPKTRLFDRWVSQAETPDVGVSELMSQRLV